MSSCRASVSVRGSPDHEMNQRQSLRVHGVAFLVLEEGSPFGAISSTVQDTLHTAQLPKDTYSIVVSRVHHDGCTSGRKFLVVRKPVRY
jgi:hypothetical protein